MSQKAQVLVLAGTIGSTEVEPTPRHRRTSSPLYFQMTDRREPLDLGASVFRYLLPHRCDRMLTARRRRPQ